MNERVVNINFACEGLEFDAAVDCQNALKTTLGEDYSPEEISEYRVNIELYCFSHPKWGVRYIHHEGEKGVVVNDVTHDRYGHYHTICDMDEIIKAAREWITEQYDKEDEPFKTKEWYAACCQDCQYRRPVLKGRACICLPLYKWKTEERCMKVKNWILKNRK